MFKIFRTDEEKADKLVENIFYLDENPIIELGSSFDKNVCNLVLLKMKQKGFELITAGSYGSADWTSQIFYFKRRKKE